MGPVFKAHFLAPQCCILHMTTYQMISSIIYYEWPWSCLYLVSFYCPRYNTREKTCLQGFANNLGADQPAIPRRLISVFVIPLFESVISRHATSDFFYFLASLCSWAGWFESHFVRNPKEEAQYDTIWETKYDTTNEMMFLWERLWSAWAHIKSNMSWLFTIVYNEKEINM